MSEAAEYYEARWNPKEYKLLNIALGRAYLQRQDLPRVAQLENAISAYERAFRAMDKAEAPHQFDEIMKILLTLSAERIHLAEGPSQDR